MEDQILIAYLAGLFDGEGSVTLGKNYSTDKYRYPVLSMTSTTINLLELCQQAFGGSIRVQKTYKAHHKPSWSWRIVRMGAINAMKQLFPYIQEPDKHRRMQLIIEQYSLMTNRNGKYNQEQITAKLQFENQFFHPSNGISL